MTTAIAPVLKYQTLNVQTEMDLDLAGRILRSLESHGVRILRWTAASGDDPSRSRLQIDFAGDRPSVMAALSMQSGVYEYEILELEEAVHIELALVKVRASGEALDEAAEIVGASGGRLLSLSAEGFAAQISNRPDRIETMLARLRKTAPTEVVRSGRLVVQK